MPRDDVDCKVYVGDLPRDATEKELEEAFSCYGRLEKVWVARNPPGFAFIQFEDRRDANDAVHGLNGKTICGAQVRVEHATGRKRDKPRMSNRGNYSYDSRDRRGGGGGGYGGRRRSRSRSRERRYRSRSRSRSPSYSRNRSRSPPIRDRSVSPPRNDN